MTMTVISTVILVRCSLTAARATGNEITLRLLRHCTLPVDRQPVPGQKIPLIGVKKVSQIQPGNMKE